MCKSYSFLPVVCLIKLLRLFYLLLLLQAQKILLYQRMETTAQS